MCQPQPALKWEAAAPSNDPSPPFGRSLVDSILVPFPVTVESCLSSVAPVTSAGVVQRIWYRLGFYLPRTSAVNAGGTGRSLLHFGAVDWQAVVYLNGKMLGHQTGARVDRMSTRTTTPRPPHSLSVFFVGSRYAFRNLLLRRSAALYIN